MFQIGWVDYSREERNKIINIIRLLGDQEALDELGIGVVRDAFSDMLFPGISTLQTRAKYFVLTPYLFQMAENTSLNNAADVLSFVRRNEEKLVAILVNNSPGADGIIGSRNYKSGKTVKMKPSNIYWNGMRTTGILRYKDASIDSVCRQIASKTFQRAEIQLKTSDKDAAQDDVEALRLGGTIFTPISPTYDVMRDATIELTKDEAEYLYRQFITSTETKDSLMAHMLRSANVFPTLLDIPEECLEEPLRSRFILARNFAEFIYGAHLLYNIILAEGCGIEDETTASINKDFEKWLEEYSSPPLDEIVAVTKCPIVTAKFFRDFDGAIRAKDIEGAKNIIIARERLVKPGRQKLRRPDYFSYEAPIHWYKLNYRFNTAKVIAEDILKALKEA